MTDQPCLEVPFDEVEKWEKIQGSCARFYAAAEWGYKKGLKEQRSLPSPPNWRTKKNESIRGEKIDRT